MAEQTSRLVTGFSWDPVGSRYRSTQTGRYVPASAVRAALDDVVATSGDRMRAIAEKLQAGQISLKDWQLQTAREIRAVHVAAATSASGGFAQMSPSSYGAVGQIIRQQYGFLNQFAQDIASGKQPMDGRLLQRAELYGLAGRATHRETERRLGRLRGEDQERSVLGPADHCNTGTSCIGEASKGWRPIGSLAPIGSRTCRTSCHCHWETRRAAEAQQAA